MMVVETDDCITYEYLYLKVIYLVILRLVPYILTKLWRETCL